MATLHSENQPQTKYARITQGLRAQIVRGELRPGDRLPSFTEMKAQHGIALSTIEKVLSTLEQEGLVERRQGSGTFVKHREKSLTGNIGFIGGAGYNTPNLPFHQLLMGGIQQSVREHQQHLLYLGSDRDWDAGACDKVDGIVLCNIEDAQEIIDCLPSQLPVVSVLTLVDGVTSVGIDDYRGAQMAMRHLLSHGHRRIACLMEKMPSESRRRFNGYRDALLDAGIEIEPEWVRLVESDDLERLRAVSTQPYREWAHAQMKAWLQEGWHETGCTALLVQNEVAAIGVMQILQKEGVQVPEQVSVIGFDGTQMCDLASPRLCAVELPLVEIGSKAVELLQRQIAGESSSGQAVTLPLRMRAGESVAHAMSENAVESKVLLECG